jgi:hypothetical protein
VKYLIKSHPTRYKNVLFRSRLEARWAAFFDLLSPGGWRWEYEPIDLKGWTPDFYVEIPCGHSECDKKHSVYAEVKPYRTIKEFEGHPCYGWEWGEKRSGDAEGEVESLGVDAAMMLGINPGVTKIPCMSHGSGGGCYDIRFFVWEDYGGSYQGSESEGMWNEAGAIVQWRPR